VHPEKFLRIGPEVKYTDIAVCSPTCLTATGTHMPAEVTFPFPGFTPSRSWYSIKRPRRDARLS